MNTAQGKLIPRQVKLATVISYFEVSHLKSKSSLPPPQLLFLRCEAASCVEERQPGAIIFAHH